MKHRTHDQKIPRQSRHRFGHDNLKRTDKAILEYLQEMALAGNGETCKASIPKIANACNVSERQVQISTRRLIVSGLLIRVGYDFSNPNRQQRGTVYKVVFSKTTDQQNLEQEYKKRPSKFLLIWSED